MTTQNILPGFGRPLNYTPEKGAPDYVGEQFPSALSIKAISKGKVAQKMVTLREFAMLQFMNSVTDKSDWHVKINNEEIVQKWRDEAYALDLGTKSMDWCIEELRYKAIAVSKSPAHPPPIIVYNGDVVKADSAVAPELRHSLQAAVEKLEVAIPDRLKDWHPGSEEKVWDLVHPSLFPLVYGRTRILADATTTLSNCIELCGEGVTLKVPPVSETRELGLQLSGYGSWSIEEDSKANKPFSVKFQWLPCEVDISGEKARITTYINNLHPAKEKPLYALMEKLIEASIPLWNLTLAPIADTDFKRKRENRIGYSDIPTYDPDPASLPETEGPQRLPNEGEYDFSDRRQEWIEATRVLIQPEPKGEFRPLAQPVPLDLKAKYGSRGLQVIVKLANIELTPEKPEYGGGTWHVEGQMNEHIVATALYYYSCENITPSTLSFRQQVDPEETIDIPYEQNDHDWLSGIFGCEQDGPGIQDIGGVETREGRLLTFPNVLQHRVGSFKLADPMKPGHRKIVALFLVDPNIKIVSTAHVPCQQQEWWWEAVMAKEGPAGADGGASKISNTEKKAPAVSEIPIELQDNILHGVDFPITLEEAKALRLELMEERKTYVGHHLKVFVESATFSLCEH